MIFIQGCYFLSRNKLSIFFPVYNEEKFIEKFVLKIHQFLEKKGFDFEIFLVDDNSSDNSWNIIKQLEKQENIKGIHYKNGPSKRENLARSFRKAKGDTIIFSDINISNSSEYLQLLVEGLDENDIVIGSRYKDILTKRKFKRLMASIIYNKFLQIYFGTKVMDHQCGAKAFRKEVLFSLLDELDKNLGSRRGWFWDAELLIRAQKKGWHIKEIPLKWIEAKNSSVCIRREFKMIPYILGLKKKLRRS